MHVASSYECGGGLFNASSQEMCCSLQAANEAGIDVALCIGRPRLQSPPQGASSQRMVGPDALARRVGPRGPASGSYRPAFRPMGQGQKPVNFKRILSGSSGRYQGGAWDSARHPASSNFGGEVPLLRPGRDGGGSAYSLRQPNPFQEGRGQHRGAQARPRFQIHPTHQDPLPSVNPDPSLSNWVRSLQTSLVPRLVFYLVYNLISGKVLDIACVFGWSSLSCPALEWRLLEICIYIFIWLL